jgi:hypothetical protein
MTPDEARRMLEASRLDERLWQMHRLQSSRSTKPVRDW